MISFDLFCCLIKLREEELELCRQIIVTSSVLVALFAEDRDESKYQFGHFVQF